MAETIAQYLVGLFFEADQASYQQFKSSVDAAGNSAESLGETSEAAGESVSKLGDESKDTAKDAKNMGQEVKRAGEKAEKAGSRINNLKTGLKALVWGVSALSTAGGAAFAFINRTMDKLSGMDRMAKSMGMTAEDIHSWGYVADQIGSTSGQMIAALQKVRATSANAATGMGEMAAMYRGLSIAVVGANGEMRSSGDILKDVSSRLKSMPQAKAAYFSAKLGFDPETLAALKSGDIATALVDYKRLSDALGDGVNDAAESAAKFQKQWGRLKTTVDFLWMSISGQLIEPLSKALAQIGDYLKDNEKRLKNGLVRALKALGTTLNKVFDAIRWGVRFVGFLITLFDRVPGKLQGIIFWLGAIGLALIKVGKQSLVAFATNPVTWIAAAIVALLLLLEDLMGYMDGKESYVNWRPIIDGARNLMKALEMMLPLLVAFGASWVYLKGFPALLAKIENGVELITKAWGAVTGAIKLVGAAVAANPIGAVIIFTLGLLYLLITYWDDLKEVVGNACSWISDRWGEFCGWLSKKWDSAKEKIGVGWDYIKDKAGNAKSWITEKWDSFGDWFAGLPDRLASAAGSLFGWTEEETAQASAVIKNTWDSVVDWFANIPGRIADALRGLKDVISDAFRTAIDYLLSWMPDWAKDLLGIGGDVKPKFESNVENVQAAAQMGGGKIIYLDDGTPVYIDNKKTPTKQAVAQAQQAAKQIVTQTGQAVMEIAPNVTMANQTLNKSAPLTSQSISNITSRGGDVDQSVSVNQTTEITVTGTGDPAETARLVARDQGRAADQTARVLSRSPVNGAPARSSGW